MAEAWIERKFAGVDTAPLFDEAATARRKGNEGKTRRPRPVDRVECPSCGQEVSLDVTAMRENRRVLGIRRHYRSTYGGVALLCPRSGTEYEGRS